MPRRVALATCAEVPDGDDDAPPLIAALAERGVRAEPAVWDSPEVDWSRFDLVVVRSTWDYAPRRDELLAWAAGLPRVLNALPVLTWNTDKRYLVELAAAGVPVVSTTLFEPGETFEPPPDRFVVKPAVSAGSWLSASYAQAHAARAVEHIRALHRDGRTAMVQPYIEGVDDGGETALLYLGDTYSHAIRKEALLAPEQEPSTGLYLEETIDAVEPSAAERAVAEQTLDALPFDRTELLYARVDVLPHDEGPVVLEVELTEPSLFLGYGEGAAARFADAIAQAC